MEQKQLDEIDEKYFGEEFIEEEIIDEPKPKELDREKKESPKKLKVTKTTSKKPEMEVYYEENNAPEIKITPAKERPPLETPIIQPAAKIAIKENKEEHKEPEKKKERDEEPKIEPKVNPVKIEEPVTPIEKKSSSWKWFFRLIIIIILIILIIKVAKYWGNDNPAIDLNSTLPSNVNTTPTAQSNASLITPKINTTNVNSNITNTEPKINTTPNSANITQSKVEFTLTAKRWLFEPNKLKVNKGDKIKIILLNPEKLKFNFELRELGVYKEISAETTTLEFTASQSGSFKFKCASCESWRGMEGTLVVS